MVCLILKGLVITAVSTHERDAQLSFCALFRLAVLRESERLGSGVQVGRAAELRQQPVVGWLQLPHRTLLVSI